VSYPYPQDRNRDNREKGEQPYKAAREAMAENEAILQTEAEAYGETHQQRSDEERLERLEHLAAAGMREVGDERERSLLESAPDDSASNTS
jgi:hypothetical protein